LLLSTVAPTRTSAGAFVVRFVPHSPSPGSNIGALHGVALTSSSVALLTFHQQHQPELLLSALRDIRRPPGPNIGALLGVALSLSSFSLPKYLEHLDSYLSSPNRYALDAFDVRLSKTTFLDTFGWMANLSECSLEMLSPSTTTMAFYCGIF